MVRRGTAAIASCVLIAGCGGGTSSPEPVAARPYEDPGFVRSAGFEMRYGVMQASSIDRRVATRYGISRSDDRAVITVAVSRQPPGSVPVPVEARISGIRRTLAGDAYALEFRAESEDGTVSYIAETDIPEHEPLSLEVEAQPTGSEARLTARITRRFDRS